MIFGVGRHEIRVELGRRSHDRYHNEEALIFIVDLKDIFNEELVQATVGAVFGAAGQDSTGVLGVYRSNRPDTEPHEIAAAIETDRIFTVPSIRMADAQAEHNPNTWLYRFDWRTHSDQARGFVGDNPPRVLADLTHHAWVSFIKEGNLNHGGLPDWPRYDGDTRPTMLFDEPCRVAQRPNDDEIALWDGVV